VIRLAVRDAIHDADNRRRRHILTALSTLGVVGVIGGRPGHHDRERRAIY
jgi:hypothetical protein